MIASVNYVNVSLQSTTGYEFYHYEMSKICKPWKDLPDPSQLALKPIWILTRWKSGSYYHLDQLASLLNSYLMLNEYSPWFSIVFSKTFEISNCTLLETVVKVLWMRPLFLEWSYSFHNWRQMSDHVLGGRCNSFLIHNGVP